MRRVLVGFLEEQGGRSSDPMVICVPSFSLPGWTTLKSIFLLNYGKGENAGRPACENNLLNMLFPGMVTHVFLAFLKYTMAFFPVALRSGGSAAGIFFFTEKQTCANMFDLNICRFSQKFRNSPKV